MDSAGAITAADDWRSILADPGDREHSVQFYTELGFLTTAVSHYASTGLRRGEAVIIVATPVLRAALERELGTAGFDPARLAHEGQLTVLGAADLLSQLLVAGVPNASWFRRLVGGLLGRAASRFPRVRVCGEMVDLLWQKGNLTAALQLEALWNDLAKAQPFALHCVYAIDNFDRTAHCCALRGIQHTHSYLMPVEDYSRFDRAVNRALADVLGTADALLLKPFLMERRQNGGRMPSAQAALMGLAEVIPTALDPVLARAQRYYGAPAVPAVVE
jgi:hypothetical protein